MIDDIVELAVDIATDIGGAVWENRKEKKEQQEEEDERQRQEDRERPL